MRIKPGLNQKRIRQLLKLPAEVEFIENGERNEVLFFYSIYFCHVFIFLYYPGFEKITIRLRKDGPADSPGALPG